MNRTHKTIFLGMIVLCIVLAINAQKILTLDKTISIAETGSPDLKRLMLNLEQFQKKPEAQWVELFARCFAGGF